MGARHHLGDRARWAPTRGRPRVRPVDQERFVVSVEYYSGIDERLDFPVMLPPQLNLVDIKDTKVLIVDDVADTGHTLKAVMDFVGATVAEARTAVIYEKPQSVVKCDYVWKSTDRWIDFPWSDKPPVLGGGDGH